MEIHKRGSQPHDFASGQPAAGRLFYRSWADFKIAQPRTNASTLSLRGSVTPGSISAWSTFMSTFSAGRPV